jgi:hypothetical protein
LTGPLQATALTVVAESSVIDTQFSSLRATGKLMACHERTTADLRLVRQHDLGASTATLDP